MKAALASLSILLLTSSVALSETTDRAGFLPASETMADPVKRATSETASLVAVPLPPASIGQVDTNKDGKISFAELLTHDMTLGF